MIDGESLAEKKNRLKAQVCVRRVVWRQMDDENTNVFDEGAKFLIRKDYRTCVVFEFIGEQNETAMPSSSSFLGKYSQILIRRD